MSSASVGYCESQPKSAPRQSLAEIRKILDVAFCPAYSFAVSRLVVVLMKPNSVPPR